MLEVEYLRLKGWVAKTYKGLVVWYKTNPRHLERHLCGADSRKHVAHVYGDTTPSLSMSDALTLQRREDIEAIFDRDRGVL